MMKMMAAAVTKGCQSEGALGERGFLAESTPSELRSLDSSHALFQPGAMSAESKQP